MSKESNSNHAIAGAISGFLTRFTCQPLDVVKIRFQLQVEPIKPYHISKYQSIFQAFWLILKEERIFALWKGHLPAQLLSISYGAGQFYSYNVLMTFSNRNSILNEWKYLKNFMVGASAGNIYKKYFKETNISFYNSLLSGAMAGLMAKTIVYPMDLARKRLQIQGFKNGRKGFGKFFECKGLIDCFRVTIRDEGAKGLFKGLLPSQLKAAITTALHFTFYEQALLFLKNI
ncbi:hypothetical protein M0804_007999 [Polistes exclamans]|nr:hypothetical protein M0804_007999 [Polistes exclamans]